MRQVIAGAAAMLLAGCMNGGDRGTVAAPGATPNAVIGSDVGAGAGEAPLGVVQGGLLGAEIGRSLDEDDRKAALRAEFETLEYGRAGRPNTWRNPRSGNEGEVTVGPTYQVNLLDCREYTHNVRIGGRLRVARGTACRQPDGRWNIIR